MMLRALILAAMLLPAAATAADRNFVNGEPVTLEPDRGYVLVRTFQRDGGGIRGTLSFAPILIRVLDDAEMAQDQSLQAADPDHWLDKVESNVSEPLAGKPYALVNGEVYLLLSVWPGTYLLGGLAVTSWASVDTGGLLSNPCMGTVRFEVKPGVITDMGAVIEARDDEPTDIPELVHAVTGKPIGDEAIATIIGVRPGVTDVPPALASLARVPADYRAVGPMPNYLGISPSRLAPLPGVLDYDKDGNVIDLKAAPPKS